MRLYGEILKNIQGVEGGRALFENARCTLLLGGGGYFQGVKTIAEFSSERVVLGFRREMLEVEGENFVIGKYCDGDLALMGRINSLRFADAEKGKDTEKEKNV